MKKKLAILVSVLLVMAFGLASCGNDFDAVGYVKGSLDAVQTGEVSDELVALSQDSKEELQKSVDATRSEFEKALISSMGEQEANLTDKSKEYIKNIGDGLFQKMKYEVAEEATKSDDAYTVTVTAYPMTCLGKFMDYVQGDFVSDWMKKATKYTSQDKLLKDMYESAFAKLNDMIQNTEYGDPKELTVKVSPNDDGIYEADETDVQTLIGTLLGIDQLSNAAD